MHARLKYGLFGIMLVSLALCGESLKQSDAVFGKSQGAIAATTRLKRSAVAQLIDEGQSPWYDNISREIIRSGELKRLVEEEGVRGVTTNPSIFNKAIATGEYDADIHRLALEGKTTEEIYEILVTDDVRAAAEVLRPLYEASNYKDGYVSIEINPEKANDVEASVEEGFRLSQIAPNVMVKVPATDAGYEITRRLIALGARVNVTLEFWLGQYIQEAKSFIEGLEERSARGEDISKVASVSSFFLSRIDSHDKHGVDKDQRLPEELQGKVAVANAMAAYGEFEEIFGSERFKALVARGAQVQRPLWASTSTKNPDYSPILYVQPLIAPNTVNTLPPKTLEKFKELGEAKRTITEKEIAEAREILRRVEASGINLEEVGRNLLQDGLEAFIKDYRAGLDTVDKKTKAALAKAVIDATQKPISAVDGAI